MDLCRPKETGVGREQSQIRNKYKKWNVDSSLLKNWCQEGEKCDANLKGETRLEIWG